MTDSRKTTATVPVDISVIVEWENVLLAEMTRCTRMLEQLGRQAAASTRSVEVLVMFNPEQVDGATVEAAVARHLPAARVETGPGLHYYQLKNLGFSRARGRVIVFLDSDVIPEDSWFEALTEPFWSRPDIQVLAGTTYLDPHDLTSRAFALGWFFPLRSTGSGLETGDKPFFANNVAFRHAILATHPFPDMAAGMTRGACGRLKEALRGHGIAIWSSQAARTSHPAPKGLAHFLARGFAEGRDSAMQCEQRGIPTWRNGLRTVRKVFSNTRRMVVRTLRHGRRIGLPAWQFPLAVGLMAVFYLEACLGAWAYVLAPRRAARWWRI